MGKSKILIVFGILLIGGAVGFYFLSSFFSESDELTNKMSKASEDYFIRYISVNDMTSIYKITLDMLENSPEEYDLSGLENCDKEKTYSNVTVNFKDGSVKDVEVKLSC